MSRPSLKSALAPGLILAASVICAGCGSSGRPWPNVGTYTFLSGEFCGTIDGELDRITSAAELALRESGVNPTVRKRDRAASLRGKDSAGRDVLVRIRAEEQPRCWLCIVIGTVGDETQSADLFRAIRKHTQ